MKKVALLLLLAISSSAIAEWVKVAESASHVYYADPGSIRKNGNIVKIWLLDDYKQSQRVDGKLIQSTKSQKEFHCARERVRLLIITGFSGHMGSGDVIGTESYESEIDDAPVEPGSTGHNMWKYACIRS